jgi:hypothetical protein
LHAVDAHAERSASGRDGVRGADINNGTLGIAINAASANKIATSSEYEWAINTSDFFHILL